MEAAAALAAPAGEPAAAPAPSRWRRWLETEHLGLGLTLAYLFLATVGMVHRALVFRRFRINLFDYAEPADFVLAALRDPLVVLASVAPMPLVWLYFQLIDWVRRRMKPGSRMNNEKQVAFLKQWGPLMFGMTAIAWAFAGSSIYARIVAKELRDGEGRRVRVTLSSDSASDTTARLLMGTTQKFIFLYDHVSQLTTIIPVENVAQLQVERRLPGAR